MNEYDESMIEKYRGKIQNKSLEITGYQYLKSIVFLQTPDVQMLVLNGCSGLEFKYVPTNITALVIYDCQMQTLKGIQQMKQLETLVVEKTNTQDYNEIRDLTQLKNLHLFSDNIEDIAFIRSLVKLQDIATVVSEPTLILTNVYVIIALENQITVFMLIITYSINSAVHFFFTSSFNHLIDSMPKRLEEVIKQKGDATKH
ncbi:Leucine-rich_repeat domain superfamily [Hexamita inflata]|uniref:Leucine-rich repeat domain superfamily n=1 Tax=Hexamita inflata TaxID=28002 RepID=A0AA86PJX1_9EUKA|nr:Leucine-rich repeat domain superfamily [Hexamita inflata]